MKRYPRFHRDTSRSPTLFFVALFIIGTIALGGMFVFGDRNRSAPAAQTVETPQDTPVDETLVAPLAVNAEEYRATARAALDTFVTDATRVMGGWVDDPTWEKRARQPGVLTEVDRAASRLRETLLGTRVPANSRTSHLLLVVTAEELLEGLRSDRVDVVEGTLLKLGEFRASL